LFEIFLENHSEATGTGPTLIGGWQVGCEIQRQDYALRQPFVTPAILLLNRKTVKSKGGVADAFAHSVEVHKLN